MHVGIEVVAEGRPLEMGSAQGAGLRQKIRSSPDVLAQLYGFRMLQPPWMPYALYRWISESRATRFLENPLKRDFPEAHLRMKGISEQSEISMGLLYLLHALEPMLSDVSRCAIVPLSPLAPRLQFVEGARQRVNPLSRETLIICL